MVSGRYEAASVGPEQHHPYMENEGTLPLPSPSLQMILHPSCVATHSNRTSTCGYVHRSRSQILLLPPWSMLHGWSINQRLVRQHMLNSLCVGVSLCRQVAINHSKQAWPEVLEVQQFSPLIKMLTGSAFICIYSNGKVHHIPHITR